MRNRKDVSMGKDKNQKFSWRAFASVLSGLSFIGMVFTGVILFVVPPGRIANWTGWTLLRLTKHQWIGLHDWFSIVFFIGAILHIYLNWKPLVNYFKGKMSKTFAFRREWILALIVCVVVFFGMLGDVRPFSSLLAWNESIKHSWDTPARQGPIPHAELLTLQELADQVEDVDLETMLANLRSHGIEVESPQDVFGELAEKHNMTPVRLYNIALGQATGGRGRGAGHGGAGRGGGGRGGAGRGGAGRGPGGAGGGFGRMTLEQYCSDAGLDVSVIVKKLKDAGFEAKPDMTIRAIADRGGVHPSEIRTVLESVDH
jgi:uncharacterized membrane protein YgcG